MRDGEERKVRRVDKRERWGRWIRERGGGGGEVREVRGGGEERKVRGVGEEREVIGGGEERGERRWRREKVRGDGEERKARGTEKKERGERSWRRERSGKCRREV